MNPSSLVKAKDCRYKGKKQTKAIYDAAEKGEIAAYIKHPITNEPIKVHPDIIKRMRQGEEFTIYDIINKSLTRNII